MDFAFFRKPEGQPAKAASSALLVVAIARLLSLPPRALKMRPLRAVETRGISEMGSSMIKSASWKTARWFAIATAAFLVLFTGQFADAAITVTGIDRASVVETNSSGGITVYGGVAGATTNCVLNGTDICDSCALSATEAASLPSQDTLLTACNERRIYSTLKLAITFSSDALDGQPSITSPDGVTVINSERSGTVTKGNSTTILVPWDGICSRLGATGCSTSTSGAVTGLIRIGISSDGNEQLNATTDDVKDITFIVRDAVPNPGGGDLAEACGAAGTNPQVCYFEMGPGDEKAIVKTILAPTGSGFPVVDGSQFKSVRFYFAERGFDYIHRASDHRDLPIAANDTNSFTVSPRRIEGLQNDKTYYFKSALVDAAGNVGLFSKVTSDSDCTNAANPSSPCRIVTPSEVFGVLDKTNCFIATAAYGTPFASEIDVLRDFRDQILWHTPAGKNFVRWYYNHSPYYAKMILQSPMARATVRIALVPIVWFAGMTLAYGPLKAGLALLVSLIAIAICLTLGTRAGHRAMNGRSYREVKERSRRSLFPVVIVALLTPVVASSPAEAATSWSSQKTSTRKTAVRKKSQVRQDASTASLANARRPTQDIQELEDEDAPPAPEYPYPGAQGTAPVEPIAPELEDTGIGEEVIAAEDVPEPTIDTTTPTAKGKWPTSAKQRPRQFQKVKSVDDEGAYIYETSAEPEVRQYEAAQAPTFSNTPGREKPMTITNEGEFQYPVKESEFSGAAGVRFGMMGAPSLRNSSNGLSFQDIYGKEDVPGLLFEYEYPFTRAIGRMGLKFETGVYSRQAAGRFKDPAKIAEIPEEKFTFVMIPLQVVLQYRFQFADAQWVVPFVEGGATYHGIVELRDDNKKPKFGGAPAAVFGGGVNILLDWIDRASVRQLDADYGINHVWFTAQYRQLAGLKSDLDLTSHLISGGFTFDF